MCLSERRENTPGSSNGRIAVFGTADGLGSNPPPGARFMSGCSRAVRRCVASAEIAGSTPASRSMSLIDECVFAGVAERAMHLIRNEDNAGSIPAASSRSEVRPYE